MQTLTLIRSMNLLCGRHDLMAFSNELMKTLLDYYPDVCSPRCLASET